MSNKKEEIENRCKLCKNSIMVEQAEYSPCAGWQPMIMYHCKITKITSNKVAKVTNCTGFELTH